MIISVNGRDYTPPELLIYWIRERYQILTRKERYDQPSPWSEDKVFQTTYFCNVHRENDKVTRWIREFYSPFVDDPMFMYNIVLSRFLNRVSTLKALGYLSTHDPIELGKCLVRWKNQGTTIWGNAYVITTCGVKMYKITYLTDHVLTDVYNSIDIFTQNSRNCEVTSAALQRINGIGSFLSAQVVADLKNTKGHPLYTASDRKTFVQPGPGSLRGASWFHYGEPEHVTAGMFMRVFDHIRGYVDANWPEDVPPVDNQDLQNCLCEFDKYCRVTTGSGRSKRGYNGQGTRA